MASYQLTLIRKQTVAEDTLAFYFEKPHDFSFKPGQCVRLILIDPPQTDGEGNGRYLSLASTPDESELMVATRIRNSAFKQVLSSLKPGANVTLKGPYGDFTLPEHPPKSVVFITGGIGITPVRSMLLQAMADHDRQPMTLFYANRRPEDAAFLDELTQACINRANCTLVATMSKMQQSSLSWQGEQGHVDQAMLERYLDDLTAPVYYLDGPPELVAAMKNMLSQAGVSEDQVRTEEFAGY